jgi:FtsZ-interacting cell division protein YlmF
MDRQEMLRLYESYMGVYEKNESCDDYEDVEKEEEEEEGEKEEKKSEPKEKKDKAKDKKEMKESNDIYDLVLEYLLDEGLCESVENAEIMMAHMSDGWVNAIVEANSSSK